ncbi:hypothetical protein SAMN05421753_11036 [Planctomicrobium piriforme]|uniref:Uncharacterized protein n=1 Tax=Planctomicrobium piriforme TaxID=1576369 RepID=A0A1I3J2B0_9PLAN|nr:hypothetical protein SAMN05421753_11036 [Planctomicrobium piriforme]
MHIESVRGQERASQCEIHVDRPAQGIEAVTKRPRVRLTTEGACEKAHQRGQHLIDCRRVLLE